jgi:release factor glutamine methyltransferase
MMTFADAEQLFVTQLSSLYNEEEAKALNFYVIHYLCGINKSTFLLNKHKLVDEQTGASLINILKELTTGKPVQYIFGETEFYGLRFKVNQSVLIPRPETEELVAWMIEEVQIRNLPAVGRPKSEIRNILDFGTGSGCIAIALKKHLPGSKIYGLDISSDALKTAGQNAILNNTAIEFMQGDILDPGNIKFETKFELIVSNPPYISMAEKERMHTNVIDFEPYDALFVPDKDPLIFYKHIIDFACDYLSPKGLLFFEVNQNFGNSIKSLLADKGFFNVELKKDMQGKDRMIKANR